MKSKRGISLIVLVITIIVMIILAAAIILSLNNAGIIGNANKAVDESNMDTIKAEADLKYAEYLINKNVAKGKELEVWLNEEIQHEGYVIRVIDKETVVLKENSIANAFLEEKIALGDYVNYKAGVNSKEVTEYTSNSGSIVEGTTTVNSSDDLRWRVLGINSNGELLLTLDGVTSDTVSLGGKEGYFNGEQILHDACSVFGKGQYATGARSIMKEDIDKITNVDYSDLVCQVPGLFNSTYLRILYGVNVTTGADKYVITNGLHKKDIYLTNTYYHLGNNVEDEIIKTPYTFKHTFLSYTIADEMKNLTITDNAYNMLFGNDDLEYVMANNSVAFTCLLNEGITYSLQRITKGKMAVGLMIHTTADTHRNFTLGYNLKPVVLIDKNVSYESTTAINGIDTWNLK